MDKNGVPPGTSRAREPNNIRDPVQVSATDEEHGVNEKPDQPHVSGDRQGGRGHPPDMQPIAEALQKMKFRRKMVGGVDEEDVWRKLEGLQQTYESVLNAQTAYYQALIDERDALLAGHSGSEGAAASGAAAEGIAFEHNRNPGRNGDPATVSKGGSGKNDAIQNSSARQGSVERRYADG